MSYKIIFDNEHFIVVDKDPLVLSVPGREGDKDDRVVLGKLLEKDLGMQIYPVHRLDFEVRGLIMFAKTPAAQRKGNFWFEQKEVVKTYSAMATKLSEAHELPLNQKLTWKCLLLRGKKRAYESPHGKSSLTEAWLLKVNDDIYYFKLCPITGRSHQLRYELFRHGYPILGDTLYSGKPSERVLGIALSSICLDFSNASERELFSLPEKIELDS